jgi:predicted regulator of Ras-like GTPase activity (Roadblock/LC7/MglB family)
MNPATPASAAMGGETINLPLPEILRGLPDGLRAGVIRQPASDALIALPLSVILPQVATGTVKVPFGQVRIACPKGVFLDSAVYDLTIITLPLAVILPRIDPALMKRRSDQRRAINPGSFDAVFARAGHAEGVARGDVSNQVGTGVSPDQGRGSQAHPVPSHIPNPFTPISASAQASIPMPAPLPFARSAMLSHGTQSPLGSGDSSVSGLRLQGAAPSSAPIAPPPEHQENLWIPLRFIAPHLPHDAQNILASPEFETGKIGIPMSEMETGLKQGKLVFSWKQMRAWIQPTPPGGGGIEDVLVSLPLQTIVPLFLAKRRDGATGTQKRIAPDREIPDVFKTSLSGNAAAVAVPSPDVSASPASEEKVRFALHADQAPIGLQAEHDTTVAARGKMADLAGPVGKTSWTPEEIVEQTTKLPGIVGALISLQDGLLVTGQVPAGINAETVAAFLPQVFGRMTHYARELKLGAPSYVGLGLAEYSLHIYKAGEVYFLVMGEVGKQAPLAQLGVMAAQLERQSKFI